MKIDLVFLIVLAIVVAYVFALYKIETMADVNSTDQIKDLIKQVYMADVEAIRNLSNIATQLQAGGLTVPGLLKVVDKISTNNLDPTNMPDGWTGGLRIVDGYASGTIGCGPDGKKLNAYINSNGELRSINANIDTANIKDGIKIGSWSIKENPHGHLMFLKDGTTYNNDYNQIPQDTGFVAIANDSNIWTNRSSGRGWVADNIGNSIKYNETINITNIGTGNHEGYGKYIGFCGYGDCKRVNVSLSDDRNIGALKIIRY